MRNSFSEIEILFFLLFSELGQPLWPYRSTGYPKKKLQTEKAKKALKDKIAQGPRVKVAQMANNFGLSIL